MYCSPVWPHQIKDIGLLPLMYSFELSDIMFCVNSLKSPTREFNISNLASVGLAP